jgi:hypothetical protein
MHSIPYVYHIVDEKKNKFNTTLSFHIHEKNYNKTIPIQCISFRFWEDIEHVLNDFDFTVCQFGFNGQKLYTGDNSFEDLRNRMIKFNVVRGDAATLFHLKKYLQRGFKVAEEHKHYLEDLEKIALDPSKKMPDAGDYLIVGQSPNSINNGARAERVVIESWQRLEDLPNQTEVPVGPQLPPHVNRSSYVTIPSYWNITTNITNNTISL